MVTMEVWCGGDGSRGDEMRVVVSAGGGGCGSRRGKKRRVAASGGGDRVYPMVRIIFGFGRKSPPGATVVAAGGAAYCRGAKRRTVSLYGGGKLGVLERLFDCNRVSMIWQETVRGRKAGISSTGVVSYLVLRGLHYLLDKVVQAGTAPGPNNSNQ
ncbi:hypothetical protein Tco_0441784 [Tanacetum coccineum]